MFSNNVDPFADIRPYCDNEVPEVVKRLSENRDFVAAIAKFKLHWLYCFTARFGLFFCFALVEVCAAWHYHYRCVPAVEPSLPANFD